MGIREFVVRPGTVLALEQGAGAIVQARSDFGAEAASIRGRICEAVAHADDLPAVGAAC